MIKALTMGSCRLKDSIRFYKVKNYNEIKIDFYEFPPHLHTIEQFIQTVKILKDKKERHRDIWFKTPSKCYCKKIVPDVSDFLGSEISINDIDIHLFELCGVRNYQCKHEYFLHPFPHLYKEHIYCCETYSENVIEKLRYLHKLIDNKPMLLLTNHNFHNKPSRTELIKKQYQFIKNEKNVKIFNPTTLIDVNNSALYLKDKNHYTPYMKDLVAQKIISLLKEFK